MVLKRSITGVNAYHIKIRYMVQCLSLLLCKRKVVGVVSTRGQEFSFCNSCSALFTAWLNQYKWNQPLHAPDQYPVLAGVSYQYFVHLEFARLFGPLNLLVIKLWKNNYLEFRGTCTCTLETHKTCPVHRMSNVHVQMYMCTCSFCGLL